MRARYHGQERLCTALHSLPLGISSHVSAWLTMESSLTACFRCWQMNYNNKQLIGAMIVAGWDEAEGGQVLDAVVSPTPLVITLLSCRHHHLPGDLQLRKLAVHELPGSATGRPGAAP